MTKEVKIIGVIILVTIALVGGAAFLLGDSDGQPSQSQSTQEAVKITDTKLLVGENTQKIEAENAKVTVVEFADFQCPACKSAHPSVKQMLEEYEGRVTYVFRHFPLPMHKNSVFAAEAAEAAGAQGKFFEYADILFEKQSDWAESENYLELFAGYAEEIGLDTTAFSESVTSKTFAEKIQKDQADGITLGVNATPTFIVNGEKLTDGVPTYEVLKQKIDAGL